MMRHLRRSLTVSAVLLGLTVIPVTALAAGIRCEAATTTVEKAICGDPILLKLDQRLSSLYSHAVASNPQVRTAQIQWIKGSLAQCPDKQCMVLAYRDRIEALGGDWEQIKQEIPAETGVAQPVQQPATAPVADPVNAIPTPSPAPAAQPQVQEPSRSEQLARQQEEDSRRARDQRRAEESRQSGDRNRNILIAIVVLALGGIGWHMFVRNRCPHCKSTKFRRVAAEEVDRWRGTKQVTERLASGKNKTRNVQTTFVTMRFTYQCQACQADWEKEREEEKGRGSWLGRVLMGY